MSIQSDRELWDNSLMVKIKPHINEVSKQVDPIMVGVSNKLALRLGYSVYEMVGKHVSEFSPISQIQDKFKKMENSSVLIKRVWVHKSKDPNLKLVVEGVNVLKLNGILTGLFFEITDETMINDLDEKDTYESIIMNNNSSIIIYDINTKVIMRANHKFGSFDL